MSAHVKNIYLTHINNVLNKITSIPKDEVEALRKTYIGQLNKYNTKEQYKNVYETLKTELSKKKTQGIQSEENLTSEEEILQKELEEIDEEIKQKQKEEKRKKKEEEQKKKQMETDISTIKDNFTKTSIENLKRYKNIVGKNEMDDMLRDYKKIGKTLLKPFIDQYKFTDYHDDMMQTLLQCVELLKKNELMPIYDKIEQFREAHPFPLTEREPVKTVTPEQMRETRFQLSLESLDKYRARRKNELLDFFRSQNVPEMRKQQLDQIVENQIDRFRIIKEEENAFQKIQNEYEEGAIISVESLEKLDPKIMYDE